MRVVSFESFSIHTPENGDLRRSEVTLELPKNSIPLTARVCGEKYRVYYEHNHPYRTDGKYEYENITLYIVEYHAPIPDVSMKFLFAFDGAIGPTFIYRKDIPSA